MQFRMNTEDERRDEAQAMQVCVFLKLFNRNVVREQMLKLKHQFISAGTSR